jgi:hypothetical protein
MAMGQSTDYQPAVYPLQQTEVGQAEAQTKDSAYTLSNRVLDASFVCRNGVVRFGGSKAMNLKAGTELF